MPLNQTSCCQLNHLPFFFLFTALQPHLSLLKIPNWSKYRRITRALFLSKLDIHIPTSLYRIYFNYTDVIDVNACFWYQLFQLFQKEVHVIGSACFKQIKFICILQSEKKILPCKCFLDLTHSTLQKGLTLMEAALKGVRVLLRAVTVSWRMAKIWIYVWWLFPPW